MPTRIAGIQPGYFPWLGYYDQMRRVDAFVIADQMQFTESGWAHRNRLRGPHGAFWLTLPARPTHGQPICDVRLERGVPWAHNHLTALSNFYGHGRFAPPLLEMIGSVLQHDAELMVDASMPILHLTAERLGITTPLVVSSEHHLEERYAERFPGKPSATHRIIAFMETLGATELIEGASGRDYLDVELCAEHGIRVEFQQYAHPVYRQLYEPFLSHLSAIDLLLSVGDAEARRILQAVR